MWAKQPGAVCVFCLASSLTAACHEHVALQAPSAAAPEPERVAAYSKLRPFSYHETKTWLASEVLGVMTERKIDYLQLAGGERIYYPEDILGVVPSDSPAGRAAGDSQSSRQLGNGLRLGGFAASRQGSRLPCSRSSPLMHRRVS